MGLIAYDEFLATKATLDIPSGHECGQLGTKLFDFQKDIVRWAIRRGRAAIFADCGMGKTAMQLEWAQNVPGDVLILAPLAVSVQSVQEGRKFGITVNPCRGQDDVIPGINITNYEMLHKFDASKFTGIVLDESSILKSYSGKRRNQIIEYFQKTPYKLACTATPAPNDYMELGNHAEFLGIMSRTEMLAMFFNHDGGETSKWKLKGHAEKDFWKWLCSWGVVIRKPSDLGYEDDRFILPELKISHHIVALDKPSENFLFRMPVSSMSERRDARRLSCPDRVKKAAQIISGNPDVPWIVWCDFNIESSEIRKAIPGSVEVCGQDSIEFKEKAVENFKSGKINVLISKPSIFGFGLNLQHCSNVIFLGLSDSYEMFYQAVRRTWRFGQKKDVEVYVITSDAEGAVVKNIERKEREAGIMYSEMISHTKSINSDNIRQTGKEKMEYVKGKNTGEKWELYLGDCVEWTKEIKTGSIDFSIFSPPFASLYTYSNSDRDMGNCVNTTQFMDHFSFLVEELFRATASGRNCSVHCMNLPISKQREGFIGIHDFRGDIIRLFTSLGWIYHSEVCIWKDPVTAMQRTKALGLLHKQIKKDSTMSRMGIPDYVVTFRKPGENKKPVENKNGEIPVDLWQKWASPIWMDIKPSNTLQRLRCKEEKDEKHICPLQLDVIERCLALWSNRDDLVFSPFAGIGSEGFQALKMGRRFIGIELKKSYFDVATANLEDAAMIKDTLFDRGRGDTIEYQPGHSSGYRKKLKGEYYGL